MDYLLTSIRFCFLCKEYVLCKIDPIKNQIVKCQLCGSELPPLEDFCYIDKPLYIG